MYKNSLLKKGSALAITILFIGLSAIPTAGNIVTEKNTYAEKTSEDIHRISNILNIQAPPNPQFSGTMGENNWYISCVTITFTDSPEADEIWYRINTGNYQKYNGPIEYCEDGPNYFHWYWIDIEGGEHQGPTGFFRIDQTPPDIELTKRSGINDKVTFTADCEDDASEVERVEFYLDDDLQETFTEAPYIWTWTGTEEHMVYAIGYNYAGLSEQSNTLSTPHSFSHYSQFLNLVLQLLERFPNAFPILRHILVL